MIDKYYMHDFRCFYDNGTAIYIPKHGRRTKKAKKSKKRR